MRPLDFRSDTLTQPTQEMRDAMATAQVGDDVFGEDPTIAQLEQRAAETMGMEAGLFVPTGTMGNQISVWTHTGRRGQALLEQNCHIALYEGGGASLISGVTLRTMSTDRGVFTPRDMALHWTPDDPHFVATTMVAIENTHNWSGGRIWTRGEVRDVVRSAHDQNVPVHIDGARIFNAAAALDVPVKELMGGADSVMFCLSKGLCAPVGSVLCGSSDFIAEARHVRKTLGGGMRQAGHLAAAGLVGLDMASRLNEDHANARRLANGLAKLPKLHVDTQTVETNMVMVDVDDMGLTADQFCSLMEEIGVLCLNRDLGPTVRFVTHHDVNREDVDEALERMGQLLE